MDMARRSSVSFATTLDTRQAGFRYVAIVPNWDAELTGIARLQV
jgi:hypothetical protein